jgi:hypothetical protein
MKGGEKMRKIGVLVVVITLLVAYMMFLNARDAELMNAYEHCVQQGKCN